MKEFVFAALPFVLAGLAVAIICAGMDGKQSIEKEEKMEEHIAFGAGVGLLVSIVIGLCEICDNALILALGPLWGMALATMKDNWNGKKRKEG